MSDAMNRTVRDGTIHAAVEARRVDETKIMQKVNAANREAFVQRLPGQLEHCMRLVCERLQFCLNKPEGIDLARPESWPASAGEIQSLSQALWELEQVRQHWPISGDR